MTNEEIIYYISHKAKPNGGTYKAINVPPEILPKRRAYMRQILKNTRFCNCTNDQLDQSQLLQAGNTYIFRDAEDIEYYLPASGISHDEVEERTERAMIPPEYNRKYTDDFDWSLYDEDTDTQKKIVSKFIFNYSEFVSKGMGLYIFSGTKGSGKTMLSCIILNEISKKYGANTKFVTATDYLTMTKQSYNGSDEQVNMIRKAALLVIDDIGTQLSREWIDSTFYELVNYRYNNKLPTIYTSNLPKDKLKMDERIIDRIDRNTITLKIPEKSIRKIDGAKEKRDFMKKMGLAPEKKNAPVGAATSTEASNLSTH